MTRHILTSLVIILLTALSASAQENLAKLAKDYENDSKESVYRVQRDPASHKVLESKRYVMVNNKESEKIIKAIKKERDKATSFEMDPKRNVYYIEFVDIKADLITSYSLVKEKSDTWYFVERIEKYNQDKQNDKVKRKIEEKKKRARRYRSSWSDIESSAAIEGLLRIDDDVSIYIKI